METVARVNHALQPLRDQAPPSSRLRPSPAKTSSSSKISCGSRETPTSGEKAERLKEVAQARFMGTAGGLRACEGRRRDPGEAVFDEGAERPPAALARRLVADFLVAKGDAPEIKALDAVASLLGRRGESHQHGRPSPSRRRRGLRGGYRARGRTTRAGSRAPALVCWRGPTAERARASSRSSWPRTLFGFGRATMR